MDKVIVLHVGHLVFLFMGLLLELMTYPSKAWGIFKVIVFIILSRLFYRTLKNLYYTFWTFAIVFMVLYLVGFFGTFSQPDSFSIMNCYLFAIILLALEMYQLYSPIFYPIVRWWEYDFRYRHDLKVKVKTEDQEYQGRLTDLRKNAGCVQVFEHLKVGDLVSIEVSLGEEGENQKTKTVKGEIISKRQYSVGRPWNYGIKMYFDSQEEQKEYRDLEFSWKRETQDKIAQKFNKNGDTHESAGL